MSKIVAKLVAALVTEPAKVVMTPGDRLFALLSAPVLALGRGVILAAQVVWVLISRAPLGLWNLVHYLRIPIFFILLPITITMSFRKALGDELFMPTFLFLAFVGLLVVRALDD